MCLTSENKHLCKISHVKNTAVVYVDMHTTNYSSNKISWRRILTMRESQKSRKNGCQKTIIAIRKGQEDCKKKTSQW